MIILNFFIQGNNLIKNKLPIPLSNQISINVNLIHMFNQKNEDSKNAAGKDINKQENTENSKRSNLYYKKPSMDTNISLLHKNLNINNNRKSFDISFQSQVETSQNLKKEDNRKILKNNILNNLSKKTNENFIKNNKKLLSPIKEAQVNKLNILRGNNLVILKPLLRKQNDFPKLYKNASLNDITIHTILNKSKIGYKTRNVYQNNSRDLEDDQNTSTIEDREKTKESDIFSMTQCEEKNIWKNTYNYNNNDKNPDNINHLTKDQSLKTINSKTTPKNESNLNLKLSQNKNVIISQSPDFLSNNIKNKTTKSTIFKDEKCNVNKSTNHESKNINPNFTNAEESTKYISINQTTILNNFSYNKYSKLSSFKYNNVFSPKISLNSTGCNDKITNDYFHNKNDNSSKMINHSASTLNMSKMEGKKLIEKIENTIHKNIQNEKSFLVPNSTSDLKFKNCSPLKTIFFNCKDNIDLSSNLQSFVRRLNKK